MNTIKIVDVSLRENTMQGDVTLSFKEKLEIAKQMDKLKVDVIELPPIGEGASDSLFAKTIAQTVKNSIVSCPIGLEATDADRAFSAISCATSPRLHVMASTSVVRMEYNTRMKPEALIEAVSKQVAHCASICNDVEFSADDATRSDPDFICKVVETAIKAGAKTITICDSASAMLPHEFDAFIKNICEKVPATKDICMSVQCGNDLKMAAANCFVAISNGATQVKTAINSRFTTTISSFTRAINQKGVEMGISCGVQHTELNRAISQMAWLSAVKTESPIAEAQSAIYSDDSIQLDASADIKSVSNVASNMGYELSDEDISKVFEAFKKVTAKKQTIGAKEMEAIIASNALQAPPTYKLVSYVVNSGNLSSATSHIVLEKSGTKIEGVCIGDGPIDASFLSIEQIIGRRYELDDFQIQSVTHGREAVGDAIVKLRANGKLYSGKGISTDIIGATINAYINAINKIAYEESNGI